MREKKILIIGASSYIGSHLFKKLGIRMSIGTYCNNPIEDGVYFDSTAMRLREIVSGNAEISHAIILLGDSNPDSCALDVKKSKTLNVDSIKQVLDDLRELKIKPIFTSTEYVFDGKKGNYSEADVLSPTLTYGKQKVVIEKYIQDNFSDFIILRLAKVFGSQKGDGTIFTNWLKLIESGKTHLACASDQVFSPIYIDDVVEAIIKAVDKDIKGIFNLAGRKSFKRIELLQMLIGYLRECAAVNVQVEPKSINDFHLREKRPLDVSLKPEKIIQVLDLKMHEVEDVCRMIVYGQFKKLKSCVILGDSESVWEDKGAKSISYFCKKKPVRVDKGLISELKKISLNNGNKNVRLCLHEGPQSSFHNMIILEHEGKYYPVHKHLNKGEAFHIIEGKMAVFAFDENGSIIDASILDGAENLIYRVGVNMYHAVMPLSNPVIYHESKLGPFIPNADSIYPDWAPSEDSAQEIAGFRQRLIEALEKRCNTIS